MTTVRFLTAALGVAYGWWGIWAVAFPQHFFSTFPGFGRRWTAAYPPYNQHLVADLGATFLTLAFLLGVGAATRNRGVRTLALLAAALFGALHLAFHVADHGNLGTQDLVASLAALTLGVIVPLVLVLVDRMESLTRPKSQS